MNLTKKHELFTDLKIFIDLKKVHKSNKKVHEFENNIVDLKRLTKKQKNENVKNKRRSEKKNAKQK